MVVRYDLAPSLSHDRRHYVLVPAAFAFGDAYLTISQGEVGPRGGTSKLEVDSYFVQEDIDPDAWAIGRVFMLAKDEHENPAVYEIMIPNDRTLKPVCTCDGGRIVKTCKHADAIEHITRVVGWAKVYHGTHARNDRRPAGTGPAPLAAAAVA